MRSPWSKEEADSYIERYRDRVIPLGCVVLGVGVLLAGAIRRQPLPETDES